MLFTIKGAILRGVTHVTVDGGGGVGRRQECSRFQDP